MLRVLVIKDIRRWWSDRQAVIVTLLLPLLLTAVLGISFGGFGGGAPEIEAIPLALVGDPPTLLREPLERALRESGLFTPVWCDSAEADRLVRKGEVRAAVLLPGDLQKLLSPERVAIGVWKDPGSVLQADIVEQILRRMLMRVQGGEAVYVAAWPADGFPAVGEPDPFGDLFAGDSVAAVWRRIRDRSPEAEAARLKFEAILDHQVALSDAFDPPAAKLTVVDRTGQEAKGVGPSTNMFDYILPGMGIFFLMFAAAAAAGDLHRERAGGTLRRLLVAPLGSSDLLVGKWLFAMLNGLLQLVVLFAAGRLLFRMSLGPDPLALPLAAVATSAMLASLFLPLALLTANEKQMGTISTGITLFLAMVGGNFINVDQMPAVLQAAGRFTPNYWANRTFNDIVVHGRGVGDILPRVAVLFGIAAVLLAVAVAIYRRRGGKEGLL
ncbi:MAG: ABC transporter permease [Candidatus Latescibacteria bacterium]|nr:ABC transporter permease [Candidatus Latescibacterota bacterium]